MSKSLSTLQTIAKVAKIVCKVIFILCIVGGIGCAIGLLMLLVFGRVAFEALDFFGENAYLLGAVGCIVGVISCVGEAILAYYGERYFKHELEAGTPFTHDGAKEIFRLGIMSLIVSAAASVLSGMVYGVFLIFSPNMTEFDVSSSWSLGTGLVLLLLSVIFRYGAEIREHNFALQDELYRASRREAAPEEEPEQTATNEETQTNDTYDTQSFDVL